ncbi:MULTISPECIES: alkaline phosphatase family protein [Ramlibacter]|uniref:Alkaline phosphatase family protein n=1 Tax=Ramlibacter aquaticus TaxID=2780094 RepID=A0ABR9SF03_9BURK|nr:MULTISPECIES: alkaline phosphatase family protein [Ramlibacter]MBE7940944.1 alkaline phosphatase family protein [Ramlibacter aquaticus]
MKSFVSAALAVSLAASLSACGGGGGGIVSQASAAPLAPTRTIIMVWDGLRPDSVNASDTPNLYALRQSGVNFTDNHSTYPTFTMMNGSSFATGSFPKTSGFYGNTFWTPPQGSGNTIPAGNGASGSAQDYVDPVFTEDYAVLSTLNDYYGGQLLLVKSLFATAQAAGLPTATIGKSGAAFIQDLGKGGYFLDENTVMPRSLVTELQNANIALPVNTTKTYSGTDTVVLSASNGNPTAKAGYITFNTTAFDPLGTTAIAARDSSDVTQGAPENAANKYMMAAFTQYILPQKKPMLSLIWFRTPDNVEHGYGPGSPNALAGLRSQDARLGELIAALRANGMDASTNIVVVSDHGHSSVSGPLSLYPLRAITAATTLPGGGLVNGSTSGSDNAAVGAVSTTGFSFSGDVRSADLLTYRGFKAFDGNGCSTSAMIGLDANGKPTVPVAVDTAGTLCGKANAPYQAISATLPSPVASFKVPAPGSLPANGIVVAANGGSDYFYVPGHDAATVASLVRFLQQREEYGAIFVDSRYGTLPGTLSMGQVNLENATRRDNGQPDVVVSFNWDDTTSIQGMPGIEFESLGGQRGMHGSFGTTDVHNTLIANGPSFKPATALATPTGNVDLAPTVAWLLGLSMPQADGRVVNEALVSPAATDTPAVTASVVQPASAATGLRFELPTDPTGATADTALTQGSYSIELAVKDLTVGGKTYRYFDHAKAVRQ